MQSVFQQHAAKLAVADPTALKKGMQFISTPSAALLKEQILAYSLHMAGKRVECKSLDLLPPGLIEELCPLPHEVGTKFVPSLEQQNRCQGKHQQQRPKQQQQQQQQQQQKQQQQQQLQQQGRGQKARLNADAVRAQGVITVMMHNLPVTLSQDEVARELDRSGFAGLYDLLYVPFNLKTSCICGYAFVNFVSPDAAALLVDLWDQRSALCGQAFDRPMYFSAAAVQGYDAHVERLTRGSKRSLRDPRLRPVLRKAQYPKTQAAHAPQRPSRVAPVVESMEKVTQTKSEAAAYVSEPAYMKVSEMHTAAPHTAEPVYINPNSAFLGPVETVFHL